MNYSELRRQGKLHGTIKRAKALRDKRDVKTVDRLTIPLSDRYRKYLIPVRYYCKPAERVRNNYPRLKNWDKVLPGFKTEMQSINNGNYSSNCRYTHWTYNVTVESWCRFTPRNLYYHYDGQVTKHKAPRGYRWTRDENGVKLQGRKGDYHPSSEDLLTGVNLSQKIRENARIRAKERKRAKQLERIRKSDVYVCVSDSIKAGNCRAGTLNFAQRHGWTGHVRADQLPDDPRANIALSVAYRRHLTELENGYCELEYHLTTV